MAFVLKQDIFNRGTVSANFVNQLVTFNLKNSRIICPLNYQHRTDDILGME